MAVNSETEINLKTLKRVDSNIVEIIDNASQVAIYKYERKLNKWEGTDIEGTLFLYRRSIYPFHGFIIVNRMSTTNFIEAITSDMEFVQHEPYFLYKKSCGEIIGSWFYEKRDFRRITNKIQSIVLKQTTPPRRQRCSSDSDSQLKKDGAVQDILCMLSEAHSEYAKIETNNLIPERNIEEDFNNINTYTDKKINNKSLATSGNSSKSPCMRSSSEEKYPVSPRRRFLSTGSYDSTRPLPLSSNNIINELVNGSKRATVYSEAGNVKQAKDESQPSGGANLFPLSLENVENLSAPSRLSLLFSHDEMVSPVMPGVSILDQIVMPEEAILKPYFPNPVIPNLTQKIASNKSKLKNGITDKAESNLHSSELKETLISHIQWDSEIMLKIHEAYVASLKSLFTQKKS